MHLLGAGDVRKAGLAVKLKRLTARNHFILIITIIHYHTFIILSIG